MAVNPIVFIKGMDVIIKRDLNNHKDLLANNKLNLLAFKEAVSHEVKRKKHYTSLLGGKKYNDIALAASIEDSRINLRHMSDKVKIEKAKITYHTHVIDKLTEQLTEYTDNAVKY